MVKDKDSLDDFAYTTSPRKSTMINEDYVPIVP
jgi:hypothetical protein